MYRFVTLLALAVMAASLLPASTITYGINIPPGAGWVGSGPPISGSINTDDLGHLFTLPQFNPGLGTLNSITLTETINADAAASITNTTGGNRTAQSVSLQIEVLITDPLSNNMDAIVSQSFGNVVLGPNSTVPLTANGTDTQSLVYSGVTLTAPVLAAYVGGGNVGFSLDATGLLAGAFPSGLNTSTAGSYNAVVSVTYDYTEPSRVPEPVSMFLVGSSLVGIGLFVRRRHVS